MNRVYHSGGRPLGLLPDARWRGLVHPKAVTARRLIEEAGVTPVTCPECEWRETAVAVYDHLRTEHLADHSDVMRCLDLTDRDLFALAIHHLAELERKVDAAV